MQIIGIYKIENKVNGKIYIGQSRNIKRRIQKHKTTAFNKNNKSYNNHLYRAIRAYGIENFIFCIIDECEISELDKRETYWINAYNSIETGYNECYPGEIKTENVLSIEDVSEIKSLLLHGERQSYIAEKFSVSQPTISMINCGNTWHDESCEYPIRELYSVRSTVSHNSCISCGCTISNTSTRCAKCDKINRRICDRPSKEDLFSLVKAEGFVGAGKTFGVSDNAIRKWCKQAGLPYRTRDIKNMRQCPSGLKDTGLYPVG